MSTVYRYLVAFYASRSVSKYLKECRKVVGCMTNNAYLSKPTPSPFEVALHLDALEKAELAAHKGPPGAVAARDVALVLVRADMRQWRSYIQATADADITHAKDIIDSSGMYVGAERTGGKDPVAVRYGAGPGLCTVVVRAVPGRVVYHWQMSENGTDYRDLPPTLVCSTAVEGLTPGQFYHFRARTFTKDGFSDWVVAVPFLAH